MFWFMWLPGHVTCTVYYIHNINEVTSICLFSFFRKNLERVRMFTQNNGIYINIECLMLSHFTC